MKQAEIDDLKLPQGNIEWFLAQGEKDTSQILTTEQIPQEDIVPALFLPPLLTTPSPSAHTVLAPETPLLSLTPLPDTPTNKPVGTLLASNTSKVELSPSISELAMPVVRTFEPLSEEHNMPKVTAMDITPPCCFTYSCP